MGGLVGLCDNGVSSLAFAKSLTKFTETEYEGNYTLNRKKSARIKVFDVQCLY